MSKPQDRIVYQQPDGQWVNQPMDQSKPTTVHPTQKEADKTAREMVKKDGGGEVTTKGEDGKIRSKDTIAPGNDPNPPRDREH